ASNQKNQIEVWASPAIMNAKGYNRPRILGVTTSAPALQEALEGVRQEMAVFAAVTNAKNTFDGDGSGIALLFFKSEMQDKKILYYWDILDAQTGNSQYVIPQPEQLASGEEDQQQQQRKKPDAGVKPESVRQPSLKGNRAAPLTKDMPALAIGSSVQSIAP